MRGDLLQEKTASAMKRGTGDLAALFPNSRRSYAVVIVLASAAILATAALSYRAIDRELTEVTLSRRVAVAQLAAVTLSEKFGRLTDVAISLATRPRVHELVTEGKWIEATEFLHAVPRDLPFIERLLLADVEGELMADVPELPGVRGKNFSSREWYQGVRRDWRPYVSPVYKRTAAPQLNVFAVAVPIRDAAGGVSGILVLQVRPEVLFEWVREIDFGPEGFIYIVDSKEQIAFHSKHQGTREIAHLPETAIVRKLRAGKDGVEIGFDPVEREDSISAYADVPGYGWGVVTQQPARASLGLAARDQQLRQLLIGYGLVIVLCGSAIFLVSRIAAERERAAALRREAAELARVNRSLKTLSECNQALVRASSEEELLQQICRIATTFGGYRMAWVGFAEQDEARTVSPVAAAGAEDGYLQNLNVTWADSEHGHGPTGTAIRTGAPAVARNILNDPALAPWREAALARGYASSAALPLSVNGRTIGALSIYAAEPDAFGAQELELLVELAGDLAYGIAALRGRAERERVENALHQSEARLQTIVENLAEGVAVSDLNGQLLHFNHAAIEMHGFTSRDQYLRRLPEFVDTFELSSPDGATLPLDRWPLARVLRGETLRDLEVRIHRIPDGWQRTFSYGGTLVRDKHGQPLMAIVTIRDITEVKRAEEKILALNEDLERRVAERTVQLETANRELESFSYSVSHDLRSPLRAIGGFSRILTEDYGGKLDDEGRRLLGVVRDNSQKMGELIDDLLGYSRLGRKPLSAAAIDMVRLVGEVAGDLQMSGERPPRLMLGTLPPAKCDPVLVKQAWANLLGNAVKFSGKREQPVIEVSGYENGAENIYCVKDNGAGFDMRYYDKLFGVFQRLHSAEEFEGTGVGLAIVHRVVTRHGGRVWAEGKVGEGAAFYFSLPRGGSA